MSSRALILAAVTGLFSLFASAAQAQNLEAGKSPSQIFGSTCSICHKSARGLLKSVAPGSLPGFLRQHYTTSTDMASAMSGYLLSNGASNPRIGADNLTREGRESRTAPKPAAAAAEPGQEPTPRGGRRRPVREPVREASRPDVDNLEPVPGAAPVAEEPAPAAPVTPPKPTRGRAKGAKGTPDKLQARHEMPKSIREVQPEAKPESKPEAKPESKPEAKPEATPEPKPEVAKGDAKGDAAGEPGKTAEPTKPDSAAAKPDSTAATKPESARDDARDTGKSEGLRPDPVPSVEPARPAADESASKAVAEAPSGPLTIEISPPPPPAPATPAVPPAGPPVVPVSR